MTGRTMRLARPGRALAATLSLVWLALAGVALAAPPSPARAGGGAGRSQPGGAPAAAPAPAPGGQGAEDDAIPLDQVEQRWTGDLDGMRERRLIRVLVAHSKTFFFLDGAQPRGLTYEAVKTFEDWLNQRLQTGLLRIHVAFIPVARDALLPGLVEGRGDIAAANLTITPERQALVDFGAPFLTDVREVVVTGPAAPPLARLQDLGGREVYVRRSSSYHESLVKLSAELRRAGRPPVRIRLADENFEDEDILELVNAGIVGMTVIDLHKAEFWRTVLRRLAVRRDLAVRTGGEIAWAIRKGSPRLRAVVDEFARGHKAGTTQANILLHRYLRDNRWVRNPTVQAEMRKFRQTVPVFRKYADRYSFDYLMVTAQAYQESRLEQKLRSHAGAVGVMQVKPSTAAGAPIRIRGVNRLDNNVHAGVKYLRYIVDEHFAEARIQPIDRMLFAFAAYNAGPARVAGLRQKAAAQRLDPDRWFNHVERVAAREIGRETVQYVSNIYKYYVAYKMGEEQAAARARAKRQAPRAAAPGVAG